MCDLQMKRKDGTPIEWEQAKGFLKYLISTDGQVYSLMRDRLLPQGITHRGYKQVDVCNDDGVKKHMRVHRLVYMAHEGAIPKVCKSITRTKTKPITALTIWNL